MGVRKIIRRTVICLTIKNEENKSINASKTNDMSKTIKQIANETIEKISIIKIEQNARKNLKREQKNSS